MSRVARATDIGARRAWLWRNKSFFQSANESGEPRLLVDVSAIIRHDARTGIQRVVRSVWSELSKRAGDGFVAQPVYATNRHGYCYAPADFLERRPRRLAKEPVRLGIDDKFLGLDLSAHLLPKYRQQLRAWRRHGGSVHIVVYDLLPLYRPEWFTEVAVANFRKWLGVIQTDVDQVLCISDEVAKGLSSELGTAGHPHVGRLYMGADMSASRPSFGLSTEVQRVLDKMRRRATVLMVGTIEPRKGHEAALDAFEYLWASNSDAAPDLVIVGKAGWKTSVLQDRLLSHPLRGTRLEWLDQVSDEALAQLYDASSAVFVASRGEGFGLPLIEAAIHRRRVLARDLSVFREQRLPNVVYFSDESAPALAERLLGLVTIGAREAPPVQLPTWQVCVDRLIDELGLQNANSRSNERSLCYA